MLLGPWLIHGPARPSQSGMQTESRSTATGAPVSVNSICTSLRRTCNSIRRPPGQQCSTMLQVAGFPGNSLPDITSVMVSGSGPVQIRY